MAEPFIKEYVFHKNEICRNCKGIGTKEGDTCPICDGAGVLDVKREVKVTINKINKTK